MALFDYGFGTNRQGNQGFNLPNWDQLINPQTISGSPGAGGLGLGDTSFSPILGNSGSFVNRDFGGFIPGAMGGGGGGGFMDSLRSSGFLGSEGNQGWGGLALGALGGIGSSILGMKNYGLARDSLNQAQNQFDQNYGAQRSTVNAQMEDRQRARVSAGGGAEAVEDYMKRNRIV